MPFVFMAFVAALIIAGALMAKEQPKKRQPAGDDQIKAMESAPLSAGDYRSAIEQYRAGKIADDRMADFLFRGAPVSSLHEAPQQQAPISEQSVPLLPINPVPPGGSLPIGRR